MGVNVEGESTLVPGRIVSRHRVLIVDDGCHVYSLFGAIDDIVVSPVDVSHAVFPSKGGSVMVKRVALRSIQKTDRCIAGASWRYLVWCHDIALASVEIENLNSEPSTLNDSIN
jgi:hypothetical protein